MRGVPIEEGGENATGHPFRYDVELVLGGKLNGLERSDLLYTTAEEEGMTGDSRSRRKRRPSMIKEAALEAKQDKEKAKKNSPATKKLKKETKLAPKDSKQASQKPTTKASNTTNPAKKRPANDKIKGAAVKKTKINLVEESPSNSMDLYERHRREFERSLARLEKADQYHFFRGEVPEEFDEKYDQSHPDTPSSSQGVPAATNSQENISSLQYTPSKVFSGEIQTNSDDKEPTSMTGDKKESISATGESKNSFSLTKEVTSSNEGYLLPNHPPYNFEIIRRRMEHGRYVIDREALEHEELFELMLPYYKSFGMRVTRPNKLKKKKKSTKHNPKILHPKGVNWDLFRSDVLAMCDAAIERNKDANSGNSGNFDSLDRAAMKIKDVMEDIYGKTGRRHNIEMSSANDRYRFSIAMDAAQNTQAAMQGKWRRHGKHLFFSIRVYLCNLGLTSVSSYSAFPERKYERLTKDVVCAGLSPLDEQIASYELKTSLKNSFVGLSYTYDDTGQSEGWMKSVMNETTDNEQQKAARALACDDGVIRAQVAASMNWLLIAVQDRVMTEMGVLEQQELRSANWNAQSEGTVHAPLNDDISAQIVEQPVWGIDCYTRKNISICLETEFDADTVTVFIEKWLLPAINACPMDLAYNISNAARILEGMPFDEGASLECESGTTIEEWKSTLLGKALLNKISSSGPPWLKAAAHLLRRARDSLGPDFFRVHPKGHGSIVLCPKLEPNRLVTFYRGEVYPSWRWGEKMDAIEITQQRKGLKPVLPDFFNMALERPQMDPRGYGLLFCDASRKSGYGSMLSHSCQPSCEVRVAAVNGELTLAMTTLREMTIGDELTFDYNAVTESLNEYQSAVCLCGRIISKL